MVMKMSIYANFTDTIDCHLRSFYVEVFNFLTIWAPTNHSNM